MTTRSRLIASNWLAKEAQIAPDTADFLAPKIAELFATERGRVSIDHWQEITKQFPLSSAAQQSATPRPK